MTEEKTEDKRRLEVNWVQSISGALAAVTSAVLLSTVGVAGTLIGAALGSVAATVGSAIYSYYIRVTTDRVSEVGTLAVSRLGMAHARVRAASQDMAEGEPGAERELARADADLQRARALVDEQNEAPERLNWREVLAGLPWKRIAVVASAIFGVAIAIILSFELFTGHAVSYYTGGSDSHQRVSIPGVDSGGSSSSPQPGSNGVTPSSTPSDGTGTTPTSSSSSTPSQAPTTSGTTSPTPSQAPSSNPTPSYGSSASSYTPPSSTPSSYGSPVP